MKIKNCKCPLNGFKPCDDACAWYNANSHIGQCAIVNASDCLDYLCNSIDEIKKGDDKQ